MGIITCSYLLDFLILILAAVAALYVYAQKRFKYWDKRNVKHSTPSFPFGNLSGIGKTRNLIKIMNDLHEEGKKEKLYGAWFFFGPVLIVNDPGLIKNVLVKDFSHFHDRGIDIDEKFEPLTANLFSLDGQKWRNLRVKLTPTFTSGKMKMMFPTVQKVADNLNRIIEKSPDGEFEMKDLFVRYTTDIISSCAFGIESSALDNPDSEFRQMMKRINDGSLEPKLANLVAMACPKLLPYVKLHFIPVQLTKYFMGLVDEMISYREKNNVKRNDFLQLLMQLKNQGYVDDPDVDRRESGEKVEFDFTVEAAAAQAFVFLVAGFETSSSTMNFAMYELAVQPEIQKRLQEEIDQNMEKHEGKLTFDGIQEMTYLDMVVSETLRKYPIAGLLIRRCTKDYPVPDTDITIKSGEAVLIPVMGLHRNPDIYPDPDRFDPERFSPERKSEIDQYAYLPFGEGPRICIGNRFALMQVKAGIASVLSKFEVSVGEKTKVPLELDMTIDMLSVKGGMHLRLKKRS